jgi:5-methylcytosine-specific restriction protein A
MMMQDSYVYSLDVPGNIVAVCPNCHRALHHGTTEVKSELISILYRKRKEDLEVFGLGIALEDLLVANKVPDVKP